MWAEGLKTANTGKIQVLYVTLNCVVDIRYKYQYCNSDCKWSTPWFPTKKIITHKIKIGVHAYQYPGGATFIDKRDIEEFLLGKSGAFESLKKSIDKFTSDKMVIDIKRAMESDLRSKESDTCKNVKTNCFEWME